MFLTYAQRYTYLTNKTFSTENIYVFVEKEEKEKEQETKSFLMNKNL